jgi:hypothetical protein
MPEPKKEPQKEFQKELKEEFRDNEVIILTPNGTWLADGAEISHDPTRILFSRSLKKDAEGYFLAIGRETKRITVEDTAYFVTGFDRTDSGQVRKVTLRLSDGTQEDLDPKTLSYTPERLVCKIKNGSEEAKFLFTSYHELLKDLQQDSEGYYLNFSRPGSEEKVRLQSKT